MVELQRVEMLPELAPGLRGVRIPPESMQPYHIPPSPCQRVFVAARRVVAESDFLAARVRCDLLRECRFQRFGRDDHPAVERGELRQVHGAEERGILAKLQLVPLKFPRRVCFDVRAFCRCNPPRPIHPSQLEKCRVKLPFRCSRRGNPQLIFSRASLERSEDLVGNALGLINNDKNRIDFRPYRRMPPLSSLRVRGGKADHLATLRRLDRQRATSPRKLPCRG